MFSIHSDTSHEFSTLLFRRLGRGYEQAMALYKCYMREGAFRENLPPFKNAPKLYQEMVSLVDHSLCSHKVVGEDPDAIRFTLLTHDDHTIESVLMKMQHGCTLCVSSQIGCRMACRFCCTGRKGFVRNLTASEIIQQLFIARHILKKEVKNVVFMGMGEPFDTREEVFHAVNILSDQKGLAIGLKHITVSTSGDIQGIREMAKMQGPLPNLALSLNAANDTLRSYLMPYRKKEPLSLLKETLQFYGETKKKEILISYVLLGGVNDSFSCADEVATFLHGLRVKINVIPFNAFGESGFQEPTQEAVSLFIDRLRKQGFYTLLRGRKGFSINAACGQLQG